MNFVQELKWRGMIHDIMPKTEEFLKENKISGYIGFDPTSDSLHIGSLVQIMTLVLFQKHGHKPYILVGGATGMVGDPSGKSKERKLLEEKELNKNITAIQKQLSKFLVFDDSKNSAVIVNNNDWFKNFNFLDFIRDVGKHITVNYMMSKDSVKKRLENGISFTEFSYQLVQGYDFYWLFKNHNCLLQLGGSVHSMSDSSGTVYDKVGIDEEKLAYIMNLKNNRRGRIKEFAEEYKLMYIENGKPWDIPCDLAFPCATQNEIHKEDAEILINNGCKGVAEGANMPTTIDGINAFQKAKILYAPGKASNAGGVATSGLEMSQNSLRLSWTRYEVDTKLQQIMQQIHQQCSEYGRVDKNYIDYVKGSNIAGFVKVAEAMIGQGII